ncbi:MAG: hypothetical protein ACRC37_04085 [Lentisphaeria bacterium]
MSNKGKGPLLANNQKTFHHRCGKFVPHNGDNLQTDPEVGADGHIHQHKAKNFKQREK